MFITTLDNLYDTLCEHYKENNSIEHFKEIMNLYIGDDWKNKVQFSDKKYNRIRLYTNNHFEIFLICWKENQESFIHNHPNQGCVLKLLDGELNEKLYYNDNHKIINYGDRNLQVNQISYMHDLYGFHKIKGNINSVSLHIYSPPNFIPTFIKLNL